MTAFTVKNIPPSLYSLLKQAAEMHHRRINSEIIVCIEKAVRSQRVAVPMLLARAREIRRQTQNAGLTEDEIQQAKLAGRLCSSLIPSGLRLPLAGPPR